MHICVHIYSHWHNYILPEHFFTWQKMLCSAVLKGTVYSSTSVCPKRGCALTWVYRATVLAPPSTAETKPNHILQYCLIYLPPWISRMSPCKIYAINRPAVQQLHTDIHLPAERSTTDKHRTTTHDKNKVKKKTCLLSQRSLTNISSEGYWTIPKKMNAFPILISSVYAMIHLNIYI